MYDTTQRHGSLTDVQHKIFKVVEKTQYLYSLSLYQPQNTWGREICLLSQEGQPSTGRSPWPQQIPSHGSTSSPSYIHKSSIKSLSGGWSAVEEQWKSKSSWVQEHLKGPPDLQGRSFKETKLTEPPDLSVKPDIPWKSYFLLVLEWKLAVPELWDPILLWKCGTPSSFCHMLTVPVPVRLPCGILTACFKSFTTGLNSTGAASSCMKIGVAHSFPESEPQQMGIVLVACQSQMKSL